MSRRAAPRRILAAALLAGLCAVAATALHAETGEKLARRKVLALVDLRDEQQARNLTRKVLALVDLREEERVRLTRIHSMAEMPLNHLGLDVVYWDVANGLPDLAQWPDLRGVITWFANDPFEQPRDYVAWLTAAMDRGIRAVALGQPGVRTNSRGALSPMGLVNRFYGRFGVRDDDGYSDLTFRSQPAVADRLIGFERKLDGVLPGYPLLRLTDGRATSHLVLRRNGDPETDSHLVVSGPAGGFATEGFVRYYDTEFNRKTWILDPFEFFRLTFDTDPLPKPDVTTLSGRRIYFSHIDGDGWRNQTEAQPFAKDRLLSSTVVRKTLIEPYPDLPVSVAPIVGDLDPAMAGTPEARAEAQAVFALPQVEVASHTWSHPFFWGFFKDYQPASEAPFHSVGRKARGGADMVAAMFGRKTVEQVDGGSEGGEEAGGIGRYKTPRAFLQTPFDLHQEMGGSLDYMNRLAPPGKPPGRLIQWSGDTDPWAGAIRIGRAAGAINMNGGDSRFDAEYPSYTSVSSIGKPVGDERQIYAGSSNENTYTDLWTNRFFGFQNLIHTINATETPVRIKPFNIYYHSYSGQKTASLNAARKNLEAARAAEIAPVMASRYVDIAAGFYSARFITAGPQRWRVQDRGALQTIRFDRATFSAVDFARSTGVLGQRHYQGSLYVALDPAAAEPVVALGETDRADAPPPAPQPYLIQGRWAFSGLRLTGQGFAVTAQGYGAGDMEWFLPWAGRYAVTARRDGVAVWRGVVSVRPEDGRLRVTVAADALHGLDVTVQPVGEGG